MAETYQYGFSDAHPTIVFDAAGRKKKAEKILAVLRDCAGDLGRLDALEIGSSAGHLCQEFAGAFRRVTGVDIDSKAVEHARMHAAAPNLEYRVADGMATGFAEASFDVIICNHVYEHVPDAVRLLSEIRRVLKPGGLCYFGAGNRLVWMEQDHFLPLLSVVPKWIGHLYLRALGRGTYYYETTRTYWGLRRLVRGFERIDYTLEILRAPAKFSATDLLRPGSLKQKVVLAAFGPLYFLSPTYIWILRKPS
jgi:SAM-dependent methyltransferase